MAPLREWEEDLKELSSYQPTARRIFWTGANPFVMSFDNLKTAEIFAPATTQGVRQVKLKIRLE